MSKSLEEFLSAFDITCHIGDENKVLNIEMQGWNSNSTFDNRSESNSN